MRYIMKGGVLSVSESGQELAEIRNALWGAEKTILLYGDDMPYTVDICIRDASGEKNGDVRNRVYTVKNCCGGTVLEAQPGYAEKDNPDVAGWPVCRAPKVDHADTGIRGRHCMLLMNSSRDYSLEDGNGAVLLRILHRGIAGGWTIDALEDFSAIEMCALFVFCRYMEQENELCAV